ncbi:MAG: glycosyltransferase, partial [Acidimicrobiales bacterium]|nr:glycosyltransferase [Acidimicrobiales bacterium]
VFVVDDGSAPGVRAKLRLALSPYPNVTFVELETNRGPAAARNVGAATADAHAEVIVFVDSGVEVTRDGLDRLAGWLAADVADAHSGVRFVASAPRVATTPAATATARYEEKHSPLDMAGPGSAQASLVGPGRSVSYVPSAVLAVRRDGFEGVGGFDESMRYGEDVDLIWRMSDVGWSTVLDPAAVASHPARRSVQMLAVQRFRYGSSAGPLTTRHGDLVAPAAAKLTVMAASVVLLVAPWRTGLGALVAAMGVNASRVGNRVDEAAEGHPGSFANGAVESLRLDLASLTSIGRASLRAWWPLSACLLVQPFSSRLRRRLLAVLLSAVVVRGTSGSATNVLVSLVDDLAYGAGVWRGAASSRSWAAVTPRVVRER